jgi:adenylate cyclase
MVNRLLDKLSGVFRACWRHKGSLSISLGVTAIALFVYFATFVGERPASWPVLEFISRLELSSLDTRFRLRGRVRPDPRLIVVDIDQRSQELLGRWPFPRIHFARMLDNLRKDGARVVAFDVTFSQPDQTAEPLRALRESLARQQGAGRRADPQTLAELERLEQEYDYDRKFAEAIQGFGKVVLGSYFLYTPADLEGVSSAALDRYADRISLFPFPRVQALASAGGEQGRLNLIRNYEDLGLLPRGAEANNDTLTAALSAEKAGCGFFNVVADADGVVRRSLLALPYGRDPDRSQWDLYASVDVQAIRLFLDAPPEQTALYFGGAGIATISFGNGITVHPDDVGRSAINFQGGARTYPYVSFADAANGSFTPGTFRDKLVLVGASATGIGDLRPTPFGGLDFPGVEVHANVIDNILNRDFLRRGAQQVTVDLAWILLFGLGLGLWLAVAQPRWMAVAPLLLVPFALVEYAAFRHGWWLNFVVPSLFVLVPNVGLVALYRVLIEEREKRRVRGAFQQYVSPEVIRRLLDSPERVRSRKTEITVMFSDIRGFTSIAESLDAQVLADLLNGYLTEMTRVLFRHQGTLDKYIGDALMAFWGAPFDEPGHARRACGGALAMMARLRELQQEWKAQSRPVLEIGIGINTGVASVGNMGSLLRYGYTAIGDAVNLASRLEGLNKEYGTRILLSEFTCRALPREEFLVRELDLIRVKGKEEPITLYELLGWREDAGELAELADASLKGRDAYKRRDWRAAQRAFDDILKRWPQDGPARVFRSRCEEYAAEEPAADWDGVYVMKHK